MAGKKFAVFDIDGTYFRSHLYWEVVLAMAQAGTLHPEINELALRLYSDWKKRVHETAFEDFDSITVQKINELARELDPERYDFFVKKTLKPLLDHTYMYPKKLKTKLQKEGYLILAISGSRHEEVTLFANHHGFDDWIGQTWHRDKKDKNYTGEINATYKNKHLLLDKFVEKHGLTYSGSYAIGDTAGDITILERVENPIAFNPNRVLLSRAKKEGWTIVIERKSIAYTLNRQNGSYVLEP